jgi:hypothetical protein
MRWGRDVHVRRFFGAVGLTNLKTVAESQGHLDMRYMLLICRDEKMWDEMSLEERVAIYEEAVDYSEGFRASGLYQGGEPLEPTRTATTVRMKGDKTVTTDGPFAETKEQLAGYTILEAKDLDEALGFVARHPLVRAGFSIEVRPIRVGPPR